MMMMMEALGENCNTRDGAPPSLNLYYRAFNNSYIIFYILPLLLIYFLFFLLCAQYEN